MFLKDNQKYIEDYDKGKLIVINNIHLLPSPSSYKFNEADVDKQGSGRNENTGQMYRERIGKYRKIELAWDLIPDTEEYKELYNLLTSLPESFSVQYLSPSGEFITEDMYRSSDVSTTLYLFVDEDHNIWQGLSVSFTSMNLTKY